MLVPCRFLSVRPHLMDFDNCGHYTFFTMPQSLHDPWQPMDTLGEALYFLRMSGAYYCRSELSAPWGLAVPSIPGYLWFHVVTDGHGWLDAGTPEAHRLIPGELALVPHGNGHSLWSEPGVDTPGVLELHREPVSDRYEILRHGAGGQNTTLFCGAVRFKHPAAHTLIAALPDTIVIDTSNSPQSEWLKSTLDLIAAEASELRPGGETVITRLGDILVVQAIRSWIETDPGARKGWLGALKDPQIGRAMSLIHRDPAHSWTVASLAKEVAMSRSSFAARFTELVGEPVMRYTTRWRMHIAMDSLQEEDTTIAQLAGRLGYRSEAAFSRAFKRYTTVSPGTIRRGIVTQKF